MMKEFIILAVVVFFSLLTYWLVEPFAHGQMHAHVESQNFVYNGTADIEEVEAHIVSLKEAKAEAEASDDEKTRNGVSRIVVDIEKAEARLEAKHTFWSDVKRISSVEANLSRGEAAYANCTGCHMEGMVMDVRLPMLDNAGSIYDKDYLIALIKDPAMASNVDHKFTDGREHPMSSIKYTVSTDEDIASVVAYMQSIAVKPEEITPKMAYENACGRCHATRYTKWTQLGEMPNFKHKKDALRFEADVLDYQDGVKAYMGKLPPDLSMYIRSRSEHFLTTFIENPQSQLHGTAMPRTGVTPEAAEKVMDYLEFAGDPKAEMRNEIGKNVMIFMIFFVLFAYLWKRQVWKDLH